MKLSVDILEDLIREVYPPEELAREIDRRVEEQIAGEVATEVNRFNVWLHSLQVLENLHSGRYSIVDTKQAQELGLRTYSGKEWE